MQIESRVVMSDQDNSEIRPEVRTFVAKAVSPCLREARQQDKTDSIIAWAGNCGCTCLCPNPPPN